MATDKSNKAIERKSSQQGIVVNHVALPPDARKLPSMTSSPSSLVSAPATKTPASAGLLVQPTPPAVPKAEPVRAGIAQGKRLPNNNNAEDEEDDEDDEDANDDTNSRDDDEWSSDSSDEERENQSLRLVTDNERLNHVESQLIPKPVTRKDLPMDRDASSVPTTSRANIEPCLNLIQPIYQLPSDQFVSRLKLCASRASA